MNTSLGQELIVPYYALDSDIWLPNPRLAAEDGLIAVGGDLRVERLVLAYQNGIFPWYNPGEPILWWSPDPRFVLYPRQIKIRRSLRKVLQRGTFEFRYDTAFDQVIGACAKAPRPGQTGTWISAEMKAAYIRLHQRGYAHSVETWRDGQLVGGLYGVTLGPFFFGESMFHREPDASKAAFAALAYRYRDAPFIDCQLHNPFLESMGGVELPRSEYLAQIQKRVHEPCWWSTTDACPSSDSIHEVLYE